MDRLPVQVRAWVHAGIVVEATPPATRPHHDALAWIAPEINPRLVRWTPSLVTSARMVPTYIPGVDPTVGYEVVYREQDRDDPEYWNGGGVVTEQREFHARTEAEVVEVLRQLNIDPDAFHPRGGW